MVWALAASAVVVVGVEGRPAKVVWLGWRLESERGEGEREREQRVWGPRFGGLGPTFWWMSKKMSKFG